MSFGFDLIGSVGSRLHEKEMFREFAGYVAAITIIISIDYLIFLIIR